MENYQRAQKPGRISPVMTRVKFAGWFDMTESLLTATHPSACMEAVPAECGRGTTDVELDFILDDASGGDLRIFRRFVVSNTGVRGAQDDMLRRWERDAPRGRVVELLASLKRAGLRAAWATSRRGSPYPRYLSELGLGSYSTQSSPR